MKFILLLVTLFTLVTQSYAAPVPIGSLAHFCDVNNGEMSNNEINLCLLSGGYACSYSESAYIKCKPKAIKKTPEKSVMTTEQIRAKRLAEWHKAHPKKTAQKSKDNKTNVSFSSLPKFCGNFAVFFGKINYHQSEKAYYIKHHFSKRSNDFSLFKLNQVENLNLLGKTIVFLANRHSTYPLGGQQKGPFQSILSDIKILQIVDQKINLTKIKEKCSKY